MIKKTVYYAFNILVIAGALFISLSNSYVDPNILMYAYITMMILVGSGIVIAASSIEEEDKK